MIVLRCDGCYESYDEVVFTVRGSERPWLDIIVPADKVADEIAEGWTVTVHDHKENHAQQ